MTREANFTIKGFLYQFNITLLKVLDSSDNALITAEGVVEDIDIVAGSNIEAIQCKYHETNENFKLSDIYEPVLQMMAHFARNSDQNITYVLYAHFPNEKFGEKKLSLDDIEKIKDTKNKELVKFTSVLQADFDISKFHNKFKFEIGNSYDSTVKAVQDKLIINGIPRDDVDILAYPNGLTIIGNLSTQTDANKRKITKASLIQKLKSIKTVAISRWTSYLKTYDKLLNERKKQLKSNLDKNVRLRHLFISKSLDNFANEIVIFIQDFLQKFHFKPSHTKTPLFCLDHDNGFIMGICNRLLAKGVISNDGILYGSFNKDYLFREPIVKPKINIREFHLCITNLANMPNFFNEKRCDDLYIVTSNSDNNLNTELLDVNIETLEVQNFNQLRFLLGMGNSYE